MAALWYHGAMSEDEKTLYTVAEAATELGLDRSTILRQIKRGILPAKKLGHIWTIVRSELERYRETHLGKRGVTSPAHPLYGKRGGGGWRKGRRRARGGAG